MVVTPQFLHPAEQVVVLNDREHGLEGVIVIHSRALGPAAGGCRYWSYGSEEEVMHDAGRLAAGMAFKNAVAGLPLGGGKAVLRRRSGPVDRRALFDAFGAAVDRLAGQYITAEDVGTTLEDMQAVATQTRFVAGLPAVPGRPGGDPSPWTARGVFLSMKVAAETKLHKPLRDCVVAVQGVGNVGSHLAKMLASEGAGLILADVNPARVDAVAKLTNGRAVPVEDILSSQADVFAPCALGGCLSHRTIPMLRAAVVCGGANNQLSEPDDGAKLADRDILYAPDYVVNAGGIVNVAAEFLGWSEDKAKSLIETTGERLKAVLAVARDRNIPTNMAADNVAQSIIAGGRYSLDRAA